MVRDLAVVDIDVGEGQGGFVFVFFFFFPSGFVLLLALCCIHGPKWPLTPIAQLYS